MLQVHSSFIVTLEVDSHTKKNKSLRRNFAKRYIGAKNKI